MVYPRIVNFVDNTRWLSQQPPWALGVICDEYNHSEIRWTTHVAFYKTKQIVYSIFSVCFSNCCTTSNAVFNCEIEINKIIQPSVAFLFRYICTTYFSAYLKKDLSIKK